MYVQQVTAAGGAYVMARRRATLVMALFAGHWSHRPYYNTYFIFTFHSYPILQLSVETGPFLAFGSFS